MSKRFSNKERERHFVELFKSAYKGFPAGRIVADENQERPDVELRANAESFFW